MKLDDSVCRGTLIIAGGMSYVVVTDRPGSYVQGFTTYRGWCIMLTDHVKQGVNQFRLWVDVNAEVEVFFPGVAYELPDYIK